MKNFKVREKRCPHFWRNGFIFQQETIAIGMAEMETELSRKDDVIRELQLRNRYLEGDRSFETKSIERDLLAKITVGRQTSNRVFHDKQICQKIWQTICQTKIFSENKFSKKLPPVGFDSPNNNHCFKVWRLNQLSHGVLCWVGDLFKWTIVTLYWFQKLPKCKKWSGTWKKIHSTHPTQHKTPWLSWLRRQTSKQWLLLGDQIPLEATF